jgi:hypothetical protein
MVAYVALLLRQIAYLALNLSTDYPLRQIGRGPLPFSEFVQVDAYQSSSVFVGHHLGWPGSTPEQLR